MVMAVMLLSSFESFFNLDIWSSSVSPVTSYPSTPECSRHLTNQFEYFLKLLLTFFFLLEMWEFCGTYDLL